MPIWYVGNFIKFGNFNHDFPLADSKSRGGMKRMEFIIVTLIKYYYKGGCTVWIRSWFLWVDFHRHSSYFNLGNHWQSRELLIIDEFVVYLFHIFLIPDSLTHSGWTMKGGQTLNNTLFDFCFILTKSQSLSIFGKYFCNAFAECCILTWVSMWRQGAKNFRVLVR